MSDNIAIFNPLDKRNLGESIAAALTRMRPVRMDDIEPFVGAGVYAIYYTGDFPAYRPIAECNRGGRFLAPIYVGKAVPRGSRKGDRIDAPPGNALFRRLGDHVKSIEQATNLDITDFYCRFLPVDDIWIPLGESLMIARHAPPWNVVVDGFGNHDPGEGRRKGVRPRWDVLHPGRSWAALLAEREEPADTIISEIATHLANNPPCRP